MRSSVAGRPNSAFTLVEMLVVMAIIAVLAAFLVPAISAARRHVKEGVTRSELEALEAAMHAYFSDWGEYPPDVTDTRDCARCIVYYLGNRFRVAGGFTHSGGPYFEFPPDRLIDRLDLDNDGQYGEDPPDGIDNDGDGLVDEDPLEGRFVDALGPRNGIIYYCFDNNDADQGSQTWVVDLVPPDVAWNVSNVHPTSVDIWSTGWDGTDAVVALHPTQGNVATLNLGDDMGNW